MKQLIKKSEELTRKSILYDKTILFTLVFASMLTVVSFVLVFYVWEEIHTEYFLLFFIILSICAIVYKIFLIKKRKVEKEITEIHNQIIGG